MSAGKAKLSVKDTLATVTDWLHYATDFGFALILALVIIDVLFPGTTGVVNNLGVIVGQFSKEGLTGLIALLLFLLIFKNKQFG
ncbi:MAG: hypothetical protein BMS9Abin33_1019 [Gammaproteobacteria bacterium]|nr:MAG: hypothetical protein BMS9Abin33_1019 [Gammaproteobacteria bacterium]